MPGGGQRAGIAMREHAHVVAEQCRAMRAHRAIEAHILIEDGVRFGQQGLRYVDYV